MSGRTRVCLRCEVEQPIECFHPMTESCGHERVCDSCVARYLATSAPTAAPLCLGSGCRAHFSFNDIARRGVMLGSHAGLAGASTSDHSNLVATLAAMPEFRKCPYPDCAAGQETPGGGQNPRVTCYRRDSLARAPFCLLSSSPGCSSDAECW